MSQSTWSGPVVSTGGFGVGSSSSETQIIDPTGGLLPATRGGPYRNEVSYAYNLTATTVTTGGAVGSFLNPLGGILLVTAVYLYVATQSTGAANLAIGYGTSPITSYTQYFSAQAVGSAGVFQYATATLLPAADYITVTGSASTAGMVAELLVFGVSVL